jgi:hypothetical protein
VSHQPLVVPCNRPETEVRPGAIRGVRALALLLLGCAGGLVAWQLIDGDSPDATTVSALLAGAIAVLGLTYPTGFLALGSRVSQVDAFGIKLELQATEVRLARTTISQFVAEEDGVEQKHPEWPAGMGQAVTMLQVQLREKLALCTDAMLDDRREIAPEYRVESLARAAMLSADEARLSIDLLHLAGSSLDKLSTGEREEFLLRTWAFTSRFASRAFDRQAREALREGDWEVADFHQTKGHRRDFIIVRPEGQALVAARVAAPRTAVMKTAKRLGRTEFPLPNLRRIIVVPDHVNHLWSELDDRPVRVGDNVLIMRLNDLAQNPELARMDLAEAPLVARP